VNAAIARRFRGASSGYLLIAPAVIVTVVFLLIPMIVSGYWSLTHYNGIKPPQLVGLQNYADVLANSRFQRAFQNTVFFVIMGMAIGPLLGLGSAILLNDNLRLRALFRTAFFLPTMTSLIVVATIWKFMYADNGIINAIAAVFGLPGHPWLTDPTTALPAVVVTAIWQGFGFETVVFLAALQAIPREYYEAATVDGAGRWARFRDVALPLLTPAIFFTGVLALIDSFQVFDQIFVLSRPRPTDATITIVYFIYENGFKFFKMGYASAASWVLFLIVAAFTAVYFRLQGRWVHYQ